MRQEAREFREFKNQMMNQQSQVQQQQTQPQIEANTESKEHEQAQTPHIPQSWSIPSSSLGAGHRPLTSTPTHPRPINNFNGYAGHSSTSTIDIGTNIGANTISSNGMHIVDANATAASGSVTEYQNLLGMMLAQMNTTNELLRDTQRKERERERKEEKGKEDNLAKVLEKLVGTVQNSTTDDGGYENSPIHDSAKKKRSPSRASFSISSSEPHKFSSPPPRKRKSTQLDPLRKRSLDALSSSSSTSLLPRKKGKEMQRRGSKKVPEKGKRRKSKKGIISPAYSASRVHVHNPPYPTSIPSASERSTLQKKRGGKLKPLSMLSDLFRSLSISERYLQVFAEEEIEYPDLFQLDEGELAHLIPKLGPRKRLSRYLADNLNRSKRGKDIDRNRLRDGLTHSNFIVSTKSDKDNHASAHGKSLNRIEGASTFQASAKGGSLIGVDSSNLQALEIDNEVLNSRGKSKYTGGSDGVCNSGSDSSKDSGQSSRPSRWSTKQKAKMKVTKMENNDVKFKGNVLHEKGEDDGEGSNEGEMALTHLLNDNDEESECRHKKKDGEGLMNNVDAVSTLSPLDSLQTISRRAPTQDEYDNIDIDHIGDGGKDDEGDEYDNDSEFGEEEDNNNRHNSDPQANMKRARRTKLKTRPGTTLERRRQRSLKMKRKPKQSFPASSTGILAKLPKKHYQTSSKQNFVQSLISESRSTPSADMDTDDSGARVTYKGKKESVVGGEKGGGGYTDGVRIPSSSNMKNAWRENQGEKERTNVKEIGSERRERYRGRHLHRYGVMRSDDVDSIVKNAWASSVMEAGQKVIEKKILQKRKRLKERRERKIRATERNKAEQNIMRGIGREEERMREEREREKQNTNISTNSLSGARRPNASKPSDKISSYPKVVAVIKERAGNDTRQKDDTDGVRDEDVGRVLSSSSSSSSLLLQRIQSKEVTLKEHRDHHHQNTSPGVPAYVHDPQHGSDKPAHAHAGVHHHHSSLSPPPASMTRASSVLVAAGVSSASPASTTTATPDDYLHNRARHTVVRSFTTTNLHKHRKTKLHTPSHQYLPPQPQRNTEIFTRSTHSQQLQHSPVYPNSSSTSAITTAYIDNNLLTNSAINVSDVGTTATNVQSHRDRFRKMERAAYNNRKLLLHSQSHSSFSITPADRVADMNFSMSMTSTSLSANFKRSARTLIDTSHHNQRNTSEKRSVGNKNADIRKENDTGNSIERDDGAISMGGSDDASTSHHQYLDHLVCHEPIGSLDGDKDGEDVIAMGVQAVSAGGGSLNISARLGHDNSIDIRREIGQYQQQGSVRGDRDSGDDSSSASSSDSDSSSVNSSSMYDSNSDSDSGSPSCIPQNRIVNSGSKSSSCTSIVGDASLTQYSPIDKSVPALVVASPPFSNTSDLRTGNKLDNERVPTQRSKADKSGENANDNDAEKMNGEISFITPLNANIRSFMKGNSFNSRTLSDNNDRNNIKGSRSESKFTDIITVSNNDMAVREKMELSSVTPTSVFVQELQSSASTSSLASLAALQEVEEVCRMAETLERGLVRHRSRKELRLRYLTENGYLPAQAPLSLSEPNIQQPHTDYRAQATTLHQSHQQPYFSYPDHYQQQQQYHSLTHSINLDLMQGMEELRQARGRREQAQSTIMSARKTFPRNTQQHRCAQAQTQLPLYHSQKQTPSHIRMGTSTRKKKSIGDYFSKQHRWNQRISVASGQDHGELRSELEESMLKENALIVKKRIDQLTIANSRSPSLYDRDSLRELERFEREQRRKKRDLSRVNVR